MLFRSRRWRRRAPLEHFEFELLLCDGFHPAQALLTGAVQHEHFFLRLDAQDVLRVMRLAASQKENGAAACIGRQIETMHLLKELLGFLKESLAQRAFLPVAKGGKLFELGALGGG